MAFKIDALISLEVSVRQPETSTLSAIAWKLSHVYIYESSGFFYVIGRVLNRDQIPLSLFRPCKQILNTCFSFPANGSSQRVMHERVHRFSYQNSACLTTLDCHVHQSSRHVIFILYLDWVITCFGLRIKTFP